MYKYFEDKDVEEWDRMKKDRFSILRLEVVRDEVITIKFNLIGYS